MNSPMAQAQPAGVPEVWLLDNHQTTGHALTLLLGDWGFAPCWMRTPTGAAGRASTPAVIMVDDGLAGSLEHFGELMTVLRRLAAAPPPLVLLGYRDDIAAKLNDFRVYGMAKPIDPERLRGLIDLLVPVTGRRG